MIDTVEAKALHAMLEGKTDEAREHLRGLSTDELWKLMIAAEQLDALAYNIVYGVE